MFKKTFVFLTLCCLALTICAQEQRKGAFSQILGGDAEKAKAKPEYSYLYNTSLIKAISDNDVDRVNILLYAGVNPNEKNDEGTVPLVAAANADAKITEMLLKREAKVNEPSKDTVTPLMAAARSGKIENVSLLLEYGANPNAEDKNGKTALDYAAQNRHNNIVVKLIDTQVIKIANKDSALSASLASAAASKDLNTINMLLNRGADINGKNHLGYTALISATDTGDVKFLKEVLNLKPGLEVKDNTGRTALMHGMQNGDDMIVKTLIIAGATTQTKDMLGTTPLILAAKNSNNAMVKEMIRQGVEVNAQDRLGRSALSWAVENKDYPVFNTIVSTPGVDLNLLYTSEGLSPLIGAAKAGDYKMTQDLLKNGAEVNIQDTSDNTALAYAVKGNYTQVATLLTSYGANPLLKNEQIPTLTSIARANDNTKLAAVLEVEEKRFQEEAILQAKYKEQQLLRRQADEEKFWDSIQNIDDYIVFLETQMAKAQLVKQARQEQTTK